MTLQTLAHWALSMGFSRQEYWSRLPFPPPVDFPDSGIKPASPALQVDSLLLNDWERSLNGMVLANRVLSIEMEC